MLMSWYLFDVSCPKKASTPKVENIMKQTPVRTGEEGKNGPVEVIQKGCFAGCDRDGSLEDGRGPTTYTDVKLERFLSSEI